MVSLSKRVASSLLRTRDYPDPAESWWPASELQCVFLGQRGYHPRVRGVPLPVADVLLREAPDTGPLSLRSDPTPPAPRAFGGGDHWGLVLLTPEKMAGREPAGADPNAPNSERTSVVYLGKQVNESG